MSRSIRSLGPGAAAVIAAGALPVPIATHESGHLLAARVSGMKPLMLVIGPLTVTWSDARIRRT